jgi:hypothetical protein
MPELIDPAAFDAYLARLLAERGEAGMRSASTRR